jgi:hypothetical protein
MFAFLHFHLNALTEVGKIVVYGPESNPGVL